MNVERREVCDLPAEKPCCVTVVLSQDGDADILEDVRLVCIGHNFKDTDRRP